MSAAFHLSTLRAILRDPTLPRAFDAALSAAADDGLIRFEPWPAGHWRLTGKGRAALTEQAEGAE